MLTEGWAPEAASLEGRCWVWPTISGMVPEMHEPAQSCLTIGLGLSANEQAGTVEVADIPDGREAPDLILTLASLAVRGSVEP